MKDPYSTLGVPRNASEDELRKAYRKKAQRAHPDRGGQATDFHEIVCAHELLSDPKRRAHYDETGEDDKPTTDHATLRRVEMANLFASILNDLDENTVAYNDIVQIARDKLTANIAELEKAVKRGKRHMAKMERAKKRMKHTGKGPNAFAGVVDQQIREDQRKIEQINEASALQREMLEELTDYSYEVEKQEGRWVPAGSPFITFTIP